MTDTLLHRDPSTARKLQQLRQLGRTELTAVFRTLPAPSPQEMDGEFDSDLPDYSREEWRQTMAALGKDYWLGKSYTPRPLDGHDGHGLNRYRRPDGAVMRISRFVWSIAASVVDGRDSLVMRYAPFKNWGGSHDLIDEVRVAAPGVYLGLYHTAAPVPGFTPRQEGARSAWEFFLLSGPTADFVEATGD